MWGLALRLSSSFLIEITLSADQEKDHECNTNSAKRTHYDQYNHGAPSRQTV
jgi:hypothetical protein